MKFKDIYVGGCLRLAAGPVVAVLPHKKGERRSYAMLIDGRVVLMDGIRFNGVGIARYLENQGFSKAKADSRYAAMLADRVDQIEGARLVEKATRTRAIEIQQQYGGNPMLYVPFASSKPAQVFTPEKASFLISEQSDQRDRFISGAVRTIYIKQTDPSEFQGSELGFTKGWLVPINENPPRNSVHGGLIECAAFVIANTGIAKLKGGVGFEYPALGDATDLVNGFLELDLPGGDQVLVGRNVVNDLIVRYYRDSTLLYERTGIYHLSLGSVIGSIAAVLIRVQEMDASCKGNRQRKAA